MAELFPWLFQPLGTHVRITAPPSLTGGEPLDASGSIATHATQFSFVCPRRTGALLRPGDWARGGPGARAQRILRAVAPREVAPSPAPAPEAEGKQTDG